jgi:hypothetical protein
MTLSIIMTLTDYPKYMETGAVAAMRTVEVTGEKEIRIFQETQDVELRSNRRLIRWTGAAGCMTYACIGHTAYQTRGIETTAVMTVTRD